MEMPRGSAAVLWLPRRPQVEAGIVLLALGLMALAAILQPLRPLLLSYLFLPVGVEAVLFGWRRGAILALSCIVLALLPLNIPSLGRLLEADRSHLATYTAVALWGVSLMLSGVVIGRVSERGGSLALLSGPAEDPMEAVERERARVSHDIHDGVTQSVAAALMEAEILESITLDSRPEVLEEVRRLKMIIGTALEESRSMIGVLRPPPLEPAEFAETLEHLFAEFRERSGVKLTTEIEGDLAAHSYSMRICVYRVLQEALNNVEQHAEASRVLVRVRAVGSAVVLSVTDDGLGFEPSQVPAVTRGSFGLLGMQERVVHLGGFLEINSAPGKGTSIRAYIPGPERNGKANGRSKGHT